MLGQFLEYAEDLSAIDRQPSEPGRPAWINGWQPGLDSAAIYCFLRSRAPRLYLEIGSGQSTSFASQAIRDGNLETKIVSIDPQPRSEIDALCDEVVRAPLETAGLDVFDRLVPGDVLFFDGSHRTFMNSDVTTFFLDVLPRVPAEVLVGVHDVYLPDDYPPDIAERYYSEQYMLAAMLLGAKGSIELVLPAHYVSRTPALAQRLDPLWTHAELGGVEQHGVAFWFVSP